MKILLLISIFIFTLSGSVEARKRSATYVDAHGVIRVQKTGKIYRDYKAVNDFKRTHPKPNDGHAYDIDHKKPLKAGGKDTPSNMQWIRVVDHRKKTGLE